MRSLSAVPRVVGLVFSISVAGCSFELDEQGEAALHSALRTEPYRDLARHWAPDFYQDTDDSYYLGEYITNFNFDDDYNGKNNWENLERFSSVPAYVYYAASETETHYFLNYSVFHPRDWHEYMSSQMHENDLEGVLVIVRKDQAYGELVALITLAHDQFYQYAYAPGITGGSDDIDGVVTVANGSHPRLFIEAKGHGIYACDARCNSAPGGDGIVYYEADIGGRPDGGSGNYTRHIPYRLIAQNSDGGSDGNQGLWHRRNDVCDTCTFASWGRLRGDNHGTNSAKVPWIWDDRDDGQAYSGDMLCDPALFADIHLSGAPFGSTFSHHYLSHEYRTHSINIIAARSDKHRDPSNGASDIYVRVTANGSAVGTSQILTSPAWKKNDARLGTWYPFAYGTNEAEGQKAFGAVVAEHTFCRPGAPDVEVALYDSDSDADDFMGRVQVRDSADYSSGIDVGDGAIKFRFNRY